jgi:biotin carboxylase
MVNVNSKSVFLFFGDLFAAARQARLFGLAAEYGLRPVLVVGKDTDPRILTTMRTQDQAPLAAVSDIVVVSDYQPGAVLQALHDVLRQCDIKAVMAIGELFVEPAGLLAACLGLPGPGAKASRICRDKYLQRLTADRIAPQWRLVTPAEREKFVPDSLGYPLVLKPVGRSYSKGVQLVTAPANLTAALMTYGPDEAVLAEERVVGPEYSVESLVQGGLIRWSGITSKLTNETDTPFFTEMKHTCPAPLLEVDRNALLEANSYLMQQLEFADGITHAEFRITDNGPVLMEVAARRPGDEITILWELATGLPMEPAMAAIALGEPFSYPIPRRRSQHVFLPHECGRLVDVRCDTPVFWLQHDYLWPQTPPVGPEDPARACSVLVHQLRDATLGDVRDSSGRSVSVIVDCPLGEDIDAVATRAAAGVTLEVTPP